MAFSLLNYAAARINSQELLYFAAAHITPIHEMHGCQKDPLGGLPGRTMARTSWRCRSLNLVMGAAAVLNYNYVVKPLLQAELPLPSLINFSQSEWILNKPAWWLLDYHIIVKREEASLFNTGEGGNIIVVLSGLTWWSQTVVQSTGPAFGKEEGYEMKRQLLRAGCMHPMPGRRRNHGCTYSWVRTS